MLIVAKNCYKRIVSKVYSGRIHSVFGVNTLCIWCKYTFK